MSRARPLLHRSLLISQQHNKRQRCSLPVVGMLLTSPCTPLLATDGYQAAQRFSPEAMLPACSHHPGTI